MSRKLIFFCAGTLPLFLFLVVAQSVQYQDLRKAVKDKEALQYEWVEKNKKAMAGVTVLTSPERIEQLARDRLGLQSLSSEYFFKVEFPNR